MGAEGESAHRKQTIDGMIDRSVAGALTEPGVYRMPGGACNVGFFIGPDRTQHWLLPGDPTEFTRESVAASRHRDHAREQMYTLADAAEEDEIAQIVRERTASGKSVPLADVARRFGIDVDELMGRDE